MVDTDIVEIFLAKTNNFMRWQSSTFSGVRPSPILAGSPLRAPRPVEFLVRWRETKRENGFRPRPFSRNLLPYSNSQKVSLDVTPGLESLKLKLLRQARRTFSETHFERPLRVAAEKAKRLALLTDYPLLMFPELFRELAIPLMAESDLQQVVQ